jgi:acyl-CoA thioesterase
MSEQQPLDKRFAEIMERHDEPVMAFLGVNIIEVKAGYARLGLQIRPEHLNFHGVAFGGIIMSLADQAFGYAVNSLSFPSVATNFSTSFLSSARDGDNLTAECRVIRHGRRVTFAEVSITNQDGKLVARSSGSTISVDKE